MRSILGLALSIGIAAGGVEAEGVITQEALPYPENALEPHISAKTLSFHYGKHHAAYVAKANTLLKGSGLEGRSIEEIVLESSKNSAQAALFNNAAQAWNHAFFWNCLKPNGGGRPQGVLLQKIEEDFGSFESFREAMSEAAVNRFGSGWAWLVLDGGKLRVVSTPNADTPLAHNQKPIFTIDVWEHAYYLDYQNRRPDFVGTVLDKLANWDFAAKQLGGR